MDGFPDLGEHLLPRRPPITFILLIHYDIRVYVCSNLEFTQTAGLSSPPAQTSTPQPPANNNVNNSTSDDFDPMSNFPSFDPPSNQNGGSGGDFKVTGLEGTGNEEDEERARFESSFPDIGGEASAIEVSNRVAVFFVCADNILISHVLFW
jgi:hypothetical protein